jgi:hypothetical protein
MSVPFRPILLLLSTAVLAACNMKGEALPREEAESRPPKYLTDERVLAPAEPLLPAQGVAIGESVWVLTGIEHRISARYLRPVAASEGRQISALAWDEEPYGRLFVQRAPGRWRELSPVF